MQSNVGWFLPDQFSKINSDKNIVCVKDMELQNWVATLQGKLKIYNTIQPKDQMHLVSDSLSLLHLLSEVLQKQPGMRNEALFTMQSTELTFDTILINNSDHVLIKMRITCVMHPLLHFNVHNTHLALFTLSPPKKHCLL